MKSLFLAAAILISITAIGQKRLPKSYQDSLKTTYKKSTDSLKAAIAGPTILGPQRPYQPSEDKRKVIVQVILVYSDGTISYKY